MKHYFIILSFLLCSAQLFGQKTKEKFTLGKIDLSDLQEKSFPDDSSQAAKVLLDLGEVTFGYDGVNLYIRMTVHERIKIYKKSAFNMASKEFTAFRGDNGSHQYYSGIKGFTHNLVDGKIVSDKLSKDMIIENRSVKDEVTTQFSLPNVKEGSVIEYVFTKTTPFSISNKPDTWYFQNQYPVGLSRYDITIPKWFIYRTILEGYYNPSDRVEETAYTNFNGDNQLSDHNIVTMENLPAFKTEEYVDNSNNYISKIQFELAAVNMPGNNRNFSLDYPSLNKSLLENENFGDILDNTRFAKTAAKAIKEKAGSDTLSLLREAIQHVQNTVKWNGKNNMYALNLKKIINKGEGDAADLNIMLLCLLKELELKADPVILSTRSHGMQNHFALASKFNYVVACTEYQGKTLYLDATDKNLELGMLPFRCLNQKGYLINKEGGHMVEIKPSFSFSKMTNLAVKVTEEGALSGTVEISNKGYAATDGREDLEAEGKDKYLEAFKKKMTTWTFTDLSIENPTLSPESDDFKIKGTFTQDDELGHSDTQIFIKPLLLLALNENPFKTPERLYPVNYGHPYNYTNQVKIQIPEGYQVAEMPQNTSFMVPGGGGKYSCVFNEVDSEITISSRLNISKDVFFAEQYNGLRAFYDTIIAKQSEMIVLKKK
jgi:hypothetical protein